MGREETAGAPRRGLIRLPAAAGTFYPADTQDLARDVNALLDAATPAVDEPQPLALVAPHAGYVYSGPIAAEGFARLRDRRIHRVVVLGPAHFVPLRGMAVPAAQAWQTPLGAIEVDPGLREAAARAGAAVDDGPHAPEHAIEVQLPFLLRALGRGWTFLPVAVGVTPPDAVADLLVRLQDQSDLVVVSTDLSHYLDEASARRTDHRTAQAVLSLAPQDVAEDAACGRHPLRGLLVFAARSGLVPRLLRLGTSADASGDTSSVVGYGAFAFA